MCTHSAQLECELRESDDKIIELRHALASLDKDHDAVMTEVDEKSETVARLNREMEEKERSLSEAQSRVAQLEGETARVKGQLEQSSMETIKLRSQLEGGGKEVGELRSHCETLAREENQLRDDLSTMTQVLHVLAAHCMQYTCVPHIYHVQRFLCGYATFFCSMCAFNPYTSLPHFYYSTINYPPPPPQECQAVRTELKRTFSEKESLSRKVQEHAQRLVRSEEAIAVKERESYRRLERERDDSQMETRQLRAESKSLKTRLKSLQDSQHADLRSIEDRCSELQLQLDDVSAYFFSSVYSR